ncbi:hypothetical protein D3C79_925050 [compost metagenome]
MSAIAPSVRLRLPIPATNTRYRKSEIRTLKVYRELARKENDNAVKKAVRLLIAWSVPANSCIAVNTATWMAVLKIPTITYLKNAGALHRMVTDALPCLA